MGRDKSNPIHAVHDPRIHQKRLAASKSLLETALDAGLSGPGRLHDLFVTFEAMTPGEFKNRGLGSKFPTVSAIRLSVSACWQSLKEGYVIWDS